MVSCKELMELPSLQKLNLVGGHTGLERHVRWVHFLDLPDIMPWVQGGELLFMTGMGFRDQESDLLSLVEGICKKNLAGLVINIGPYISAIPESVIRLANELGFPIFELPWEVRIVEVNQDISRYIVLKQVEEKSIHDLLDNILFNVVYDDATIMRRADYYGYDLTKPHQVGIIRASDFENIVQGHHDELALIKIKDEFETIVRQTLSKHHKKVLFVSRMDSVIFLLPEMIYKNRNQLEHGEIMQEVIETCRLRLPDLNFSVGLGNWFTNLDAAKISFDQARLVLKFIDFIDEKNKVYCYEELGVYKLLFELDESILVGYFEETLGQLTEYDNKHGAELVPTLLIYLQENSNAIQAAKKLFIHKNTLIYRIKKIEKITGKQLDKMHDRITLQMGLIIGKQIVS